MRKVELRMNELEKYQAIKNLIKTNGNKKRTAVSLKLSVRQVDRLIIGYKEFGKAFFIHGNRGRKPAHALSQDDKNLIEELYVSKYFDCTYTLFAELLAEYENIFISVDEVRTLLRERYIFSPRTHRTTKKTMKNHLLAQKEKCTTKKQLAVIQKKLVALEDAHPRQPRCIYFGEEIQIDACIHSWFANTKTTLHAAIDDSTGTILAAYFDKQETLNGYYNILFQILTKYGIPYLFKADRRTVFDYKRKGTTSDEDNTFTQFAYACTQLGTTIETSSTPEFKPRIEKLFGTLQNRLNVALRLAKITTIQEANNFLPAFLDKYNSKFALCIDNTKSVFEKQPDFEKINLTLSVLSRRIVDTGHAISFKNKYYRFVNSIGTPIYFGKGTKCMVIKAFDNSLYVTVDNNIFSLEEIPKTQTASKNFDTILPEVPKTVYIPKMIHPWKMKSFESFAKNQNIKYEKNMAVC